jgi:hypothetical protein
MALLYVVEGRKAVDAEGGVWNLVEGHRWQLDEAPSRPEAPRLTMIEGGCEGAPASGSPDRDHTRTAHARG